MLNSTSLYAAFVEVMGVVGIGVVGTGDEDRAEAGGEGVAENEADAVGGLIGLMSCVRTCLHLHSISGT
jgi:hypothetical protein